MPSKDPAKIAEKNRRYRLAHREELNTKAREKAKTEHGREKARKYRQTYFEKHPEMRPVYVLRPRLEPFDPANEADPRHGTAGGYSNHKCRCARCTDAWRVAHHAYMIRRRARAVEQIPAALSDIEQDIRAMKGASIEGVEAIRRSMEGLDRFTPEAQAVYASRKARE